MASSRSSLRALSTSPFQSFDDIFELYDKIIMLILSRWVFGEENGLYCRRAVHDTRCGVIRRGVADATKDRRIDIHIFSNSETFIDIFPFFSRVLER